MYKVMGAALVASLSGLAMGQIAPRIDYRVLAEFGSSAGGDWPFVADLALPPQALVQFADGSVIWHYSRMHWISDGGAQEILTPGTRVAGLPDEDLRYSLPGVGFQPGQRAFRLDDGRSAYRVRYQSVAPGGSSGYAMILGLPGAPERADSRGNFRVSRDGLVLQPQTSQSLASVGPFGGTLVPVLTRGMPIGGVASAGETLASGIDYNFRADGSISFAGDAARSLRRFPGLYRNGEARATVFGSTPVPGVSIPIYSPSCSNGVVLSDGSVLMAGGGFSSGAWMVHPDGTGHDMVTPSTVLPGYPPSARISSSFSVAPTATADGRIYLRVGSVTLGTSEIVQMPGLFEFENGTLRSIVVTGDPRLQSPGGQVAQAAAFRNGAQTWISSGGRIAWLASDTTGGVSVVFAHRTGVVLPALWKAEAAPAMLAAFGRVESLGCSGSLEYDETSTGTDMPSSTTRLAADGSLTFWVRTRHDATNRDRVFAVSARLNLCPPDVNEDGFVDFFDYDAFVGCFESGEACGRFNIGDFNQDGFTDFFDYSAFVEAFEVGC